MPRKKGQIGRNPKLSAEQVAEIRRSKELIAQSRAEIVAAREKHRRLRREHNMKVLSEKFGVQERVITNIWRRKTYNFETSE